MNLVNNTDLIIFSTYYSDNVLKNVLVNPINLRKVNIPTILINSTDKISKIYYIIPNYQNDFLVKDSIYLYSEFKKEHKFQTFGRYILDLQDTLCSFRVTVEDKMMFQRFLLKSYYWIFKKDIFLH